MSGVGVGELRDYYGAVFRDGVIFWSKLHHAMAPF